MAAVPMSLQSSAPRAGVSYSIRLKNGRVLRHQAPLALAQFQSDIRLAGFWLESSLPPLASDQAADADPSDDVALLPF